MYERTASTDIGVMERWATGIGWIAHPEEDANRASHAIRRNDGACICDPLDGPGVQAELDAALDTARRHLQYALVNQTPTQGRAIVSALQG